MNAIRTFIDTKTIIVNLLKADKKNYLSFGRLHGLLQFIYDELKKCCALDNYNIFFNINFDAIERTVLYDNQIFGLDIDEGRIYLRESQNIDQLAEQYQVDSTIGSIISRYVA